ncbi:MAG: ATP-binding protein [Bryobacterales bacterium]|nr:ATP-binding protein [Bryobacterales bacterium]MDE0261490.1 ATP-binding protein [Bryobacterales bacterium]MDE0621383.1 ATP-binding protein [Bryobacterales bacterium]
MDDLQYLPRIASGLLERALAASPVVVLMGARQTGKSTLVQSEPFLADRLYLTLDDLGTHERARMAPDDLVRSAPRLTLDEVQREPDLLLSVKRAVDEDRPRRNGRFVLTGSANLLLMHRVSETLAGRAVYVNLWPLTRQERLGFGRPGIWSEFLSNPVSQWPELVSSRRSVAADWRDEVCRGGYPTPAMELPRDARSLWFDGYLRTYLERDLQAMASVGNLVDFRRLMRATCLRLGNVVNQAELGRDTRVPRATVQRYLNLLETSYQLVRLEPYVINRTKRLVKSPKLYWSDTALALWLSGSREASGAHLETLVLNDLMAWRDGQTPAPEVLFWRTTTELEVDFVLESDSRLLPIEVKAARSPGYSATRGIRAFRQEYGERCPGGLLLHGGEHTQWISDRVLAVPWWRVL